MKTPEEILKLAELVKPRHDLAEHYLAVKTLRGKGKSWEEIAKFLVDNDVDTDRAQVFRMYTKADKQSEFKVPPMDAYVTALRKLRESGKINGSALAMLEHHYRAHNRTVTYTQLAQAAYDKSEKASTAPNVKVGHHAANSLYGTLGKMLGDELNMKFLPANDRGRDFTSSSIGVENALRLDGSEFQLVMHHELAKALDKLQWFK